MQSRVNGFPFIILLLLFKPWIDLSRVALTTFLWWTVQIPPWRTWRRSWLSFWRSRSGCRSSRLRSLPFRGTSHRDGPPASATGPCRYDPATRGRTNEARTVLAVRLDGALVLSSRRWPTQTWPPRRRWKSTGTRSRPRRGRSSSSGLGTRPRSSGVTLSKTWPWCSEARLHLGHLLKGHRAVRQSFSSCWRNWLSEPSSCRFS